jgi:hypothetical protein
MVMLPALVMAQFRPYGSNKSVHKSKIKKSHWDAGVALGPAFALTDVGGIGQQRRPSILDVQLRKTQMSYGGFARYKIMPINFGIYGGLHYSKIAGDDKLSVNTSRYIRGKSFTNNIVDFVARFEYYIPVTRFISYPVDIYVSTGINLFYHKPVLYEDPEDIYNPKGVKQPYSNIQLGTPFSAGAFYTFDNNIRAGLDVCWRKTYTDYLDGFTRPASKGNDGFFTVTANVSYVLSDVNKGRMSSYKKPSYYKKSKFSKRKLGRKRFHSRPKY